jgi:hypothetical protein
VVDLVLLLDKPVGLYFSLPLMWSFSASHAVALVLACQAQGLLKKWGASRVGFGWMLGLSAILQLIFLLPAWIIAVVAVQRARHHWLTQGARAGE